MLDRQVQWVPSVPLDPRDRQDQLGLQELMVPQVQWDLLDQLDRQDPMEIREMKAL